MAERPVAPFTLSLVGLIVQFIAALVIGAAALGMFQAFGTTGSMMGGMMGTYYSGSGMMGSYSPWLMSGWGWGGLTWMWIPLLTATLGVAVVGVFMMSRSEVNSFRTGSVLVLIASLLAFPTAWGFFAGSLLMLIGSILGLTWTPVAQKTPGN
jgi:hypothetical protein